MGKKCYFVFYCHNTSLSQHLRSALNYKVLYCHIMVKAESFEIFFVINLICIYWCINWTETTWKDNVVWVCNPTIQLRLMFSDQQAYYKVLCGHIIVKFEYLWNSFHHQLESYILINKLIMENLEKINWLGFVTPQYIFVSKFSDQKWYYKVLRGHIIIKFGSFKITFHDQLHMYMMMNKSGKNNWKNNATWVDNATIQLHLIFEIRNDTMKCYVAIS